MQLFHLSPALVLVNSESSHTMSAGTVLDDPGFDASDVDVSMHFEEHGEFGVTCKATSGCITARRRRRRREWNAMSSEFLTATGCWGKQEHTEEEESGRMNSGKQKK